MKVILLFTWLVCIQAVAEIQKTECSSEGMGCTEAKYFRNKQDSGTSVKGPSVYRTEQTSSTVTVFWYPAPGEGTTTKGYAVCYAKTPAPIDLCNMQKFVGKDKQSSNGQFHVELASLQPYAEYIIAIKIQVHGNYGDLGTSRTIRTNCNTDSSGAEESGCSNNALCLNGVCVCNDGYIMENNLCRKIDCDDNPCSNIATCDDVENVNCKCPEDSFGNGYVCYETPCYSSPCLNGGSCTKDADQKFKCACPIGFSGVKCEIPDIEFLCSETVNIPYCNDTLDCNSDSDCNDVNAICNLNNVCGCKDGYVMEGKKCMKIKDLCNDNGICKLKIERDNNCVTLVCDCFEGHSGAKCQNNDTDSVQHCNDHGTWVSGKEQCNCNDGYAGKFCADREHQSYIHFPRIHFAGKFQADESTINNYNDNFYSETFPGPEKGWNPTGSSQWRLIDTRITRVCYANENCIGDVIVNQLVEDANFGASAKLVDLDVDFQSSSEIYGWSIQVKDFFKGDFKRVGFQYMWPKRRNAPGVSGYGAVYQSVLTNVKFGSKSDLSEITTYLKNHLKKSEKKELSIRLNVDMYDPFDTSANYTYGRIVGSIGISGLDSPSFFTFGRMLKPNGDDNLNFWFSPFVYEKKENALLIDLGNSLAIARDGGLVKSIGNLAIAYVHDSENEQVRCPVGDSWKPVSYIDFGDLKKYTLTSGILKINVQNTDLSGSRVILAQVDEDRSCKKVVLAEDKQGFDVHPLSRWTFRTEPDKYVNVILFITVFGKYPEKKNQSQITVESSPYVVSGTGKPEGKIENIEEIHEGIFEVTIKTVDPKHARQFIDGQVNGFQYYLSTRKMESGGLAALNSAIVLFVWDKYEIPTQPNWVRHVQPIFQQYANLYPVMKINFLDLSNYHEVVNNKYALIKTLSLDVEDPRYMPVTRDLSPEKNKMILKWLNNDRPTYGVLNIGLNMDTLKQLLQTALQLEHATIPPYLTGYLSIKKGYNTEVKSLLKDILVDEMHHLAQVSNILNAIDGNPNMFTQHFVPSYPSYLPGGVHPEVKIAVNKISMLQIRNVYMLIETPFKELDENGLTEAIEKIIEESLDLKFMGAEELPKDDPSCQHVLTLFNDAVRRSDNIQVNHDTIGQLYTTILIVIAKLKCDGKLQFNGTRSQLEIRGDKEKRVIKVSNFETAVQAIKNIMKEGEGSSPCNPLDENINLSHYYKFASMANKRHLKTIKKGDTSETDNECGQLGEKTFAYVGKKLSFDENGVWPTVDNPVMSMYKDGSRAQNLAKSFGKMYWKLLEKLQNVFHGNTFMFNDTIAIMKDLIIYGNRLVQTPVEENGDPNIGPNAGPVYPTTEPQ